MDVLSITRVHSSGRQCLSTQLTMPVTSLTGHTQYISRYTGNAGVNCIHWPNLSCNANRTSGFGICIHSYDCSCLIIYKNAVMKIWSRLHNIQFETKIKKSVLSHECNSKLYALLGIRMYQTGCKIAIINIANSPTCAATIVTLNLPYRHSTQLDMTFCFLEVPAS